MRSDILFEFRNDFGFIVLQRQRNSNFVGSGKPEFQGRNHAKLGAFRSGKGCFCKKHLTFLHSSN